MHPGDTVGHYEIVGPLGKGGMGEVFVAEDTRLHRRVALKVLPQVFASDADARQRFEREAQAVAALNHPNIVTIHSVEQEDGRPFLTMELVEGSPLSESIPRGGLPIERLLKVGIDVADAIAAAQQRGITHRDIKPANIMVTPSGRVKVLDFGLAKVHEAESAAGGEDLTRMSTRNDLTGSGRIIGTVAYMSPEQAEGKPVDPRSDIFSLGVVLHEMATGERPFKGDTNVSIISSIIKDTPAPITDSNPNLPADLARIIRRCLAKDPDRRYQTAADLRNELDELKQDTASGIVAAVRPPARKRSAVLPIVGVAVLLAIAAGGWLLWRGSWSSSRPDATFTIDRLSRLTSTGTASLAAISPDGRYVVHVKGEPAGNALWMRQTAAASDVRIVPPTDARFDGIAFTPDGNFVYYSLYPRGGGLASLYRVPVLGGAPAKLIDDIDSPVTFSPDARQIAFLRATITEGTTALMIADANGGNVRALASAAPPDRFESEGAAWSPDGATILTTASSTRPGVVVTAYAVDVKTGTAKPIGGSWGLVRDVHWLPDGRSYLLTGVDLSGANNSQIWRVTYPAGERTRVTNDLNSYSGLSLSADAKSLATVQSETTAGVYIARGPDQEPITVSAGPGRADGNTGIAWLPDDRLVYTSTASGLPQLWITDADGANPRQLTPTGPPSMTPWSTPDGRWIYYSGFAKQIRATLFRISPDGSDPEEIKTGMDARTPIVSPDGKTVYFTTGMTGAPRVMKIPAEGGTAQPVSDEYFRATGISFDGQRLIGLTWSGEQRRSVVAFFHLAEHRLERTDASGGALFLPDGSLALSQRTQGKSSIVVRTGQGLPPRLLTPPHPESIFGGAVSKSGRIAYSRGIQTSDVLLMTAK